MSVVDGAKREQQEVEMARMNHTDRGEVARFEALSDSWWQAARGLRALHDITPTRAGYIASRSPLEGQGVLDVGCGGGILSEALARRGARVTGIDPGEGAIRAAKGHSRDTGLDLEYRQITAEAHAAEHAAEYDLVLCMELLEHVPSPGDMVRLCAGMVRPGGDVFFATLNRNPLAAFLAVHVAEYCLGVVAKGTHDWRAFIRPRELAAWAEQAGLRVLDVSGLLYIPGIRLSRVAGPAVVNYLMHCRRPEGGKEGTSGAEGDGYGGKIWKISRLTPHQRRKQLGTAGGEKGTASFGSERMDPLRKPERVRRHFAGVAERYDFMNTLLSLGMHRLWKRRAVDWAVIRSGERIADVCGGTGDLARLARDAAQAKGVFAVCDFTLPMLRVGRQKGSQANLGLDWIQGDAERLPFGEETLDAVLLGFGIRNLADPSAAVREILRVLRPGGRLLCLEFSRPENPAFRALYDLYSFTAMPLLGRLFAGSGLAYLRLAQTIRRFPVADDLTRFFGENGFVDAEYRLFTNGVAAAHLARKPK